MNGNKLSLSLLLMAICLLMPLLSMAQVDGGDMQINPDPDARQNGGDVRKENSRGRISTNGDDFVYIDDEQFADSTAADSVALKNPKLAGWLSFAVPGAGQVYNGQYWKVPIIYGGIGTMIYVSQFYNTRYKQLKNDEHYFLAMQAGDSTYVGVNLFGLTNESDIVRYMVKYRRYRDLCYVGIMLVYVMNIFDAVVDAHLYDYDVSDNISLRVEPYATGPVMAHQNPAFGARLVLRF